MPDIGQELSSIDFESMIGGPLNAVIRAQAMAATTSVDYIRSVGFKGDQDNLEPQSVTFTYERPIEKLDANGQPTGELEDKKFKLTVPFLTMLPIPFIRIEETTIDFNAKINSVQYSEVTSKHDLGAELTAKAGWGWGSAKLKVTYSYQRTSTAGEKTERTYSMKVHVRAVQDELPAGTERLLSILENAIRESPK